MKTPILVSTLLCLASTVHAQGASTTAGPTAGRQVFAARCAGCHGSDGNGGELGPGIATRVPTRSDQELTTLFRQGLPASGMPAFTNLSDTDAASLIQFLRTLKPRAGTAPVRATVTVGGAPLAGLVLNHSQFDMQLLGDDRKIHLLRGNGTQMKAVTSQADWTSYNGGYTGSRYST